MSFIVWSLICVIMFFYTCCLYNIYKKLNIFFIRCAIINGNLLYAVLTGYNL